MCPQDAPFTIYRLRLVVDRVSHQIAAQFMVPTDLAVGPCEVGVKLPDGLSARKVKIGSKLFRRTDNRSLVENEHLYSRDLFAEFIRSEVESNTGE